MTISPSEAPGARAAGWVVLLAVVVCWLSPPASAQPSRMPAPEESRNPYVWPSLDELVERSDAIVAGEVVDLRSAWTADRREIFTTVTLRPDRRFKGGERSLIRFRIPGGTVGDTRLTVTHVPVFSVGEAALVFLAGASGLAPGRYVLWASPLTERPAHHRLSGLAGPSVLDETVLPYPVRVTAGSVTEGVSIPVRRGRECRAPAPCGRQ